LRSLEASVVDFCGGLAVFQVVVALVELTFHAVVQFLSEAALDFASTKGSSE
jgi:hypothetical protein